MKTYKRLIALFILSLTYSCTAIHQGMITGTTPMNNTSIELVDNVYSYSRVNYFLGFGGSKKTSMLVEAKQKLYANYPLQPGESFENLILTERKKFYLFPIVVHEVLINADVVKRDTNFQVKVSEKYFNRSAYYKMDTTNFFSFNQDVVYLKSNAGIRVYRARIIDNKPYKCTLIQDDAKVLTLNSSRVFALNGAINGFGVGADVFSKKHYTHSGKIIGINQNRALVKLDAYDGHYMTIPYRNLVLNVGNQRE